MPSTRTHAAGDGGRIDADHRRCMRQHQQPVFIRKQRAFE